MKDLSFCINHWYAWSPDADTEDKWLTKLDGKVNAQTAKEPTLEQIPALKRRRLSYFSKMAIQAAMCLHEKGDIETVFASRHGDIYKTSELLEQLAAEEGVSPTQFGLSVHNAVAGQYHILSKNHAASNTISATSDSFIMGLLDAVSRLNSSNNESLLFIFVEQGLPDIYQKFKDKNEEPLSIGLKLSKKEGIRCRLNLQEGSSCRTVYPPIMMIEALLKKYQKIEGVRKRGKWCIDFEY